MAILMLAERGYLSLDDDVRGYVPELSDFGAPIRIRHLLHHTSGLRDWPGTLALAGWDFMDVMSYEQILAMAFRQRDLNFPPGTDHAYSNTGYNLLAEVVARVTGQSFRKWADGNLFAPLGMSSTHVHDDPTEVVAGRADSYRRQANGYHRVASSLTGVGSSSLFTSLDDMSRWVLNFDVPEVGGRAVIERMHQRGALDSGNSIDYGYGLSVDSYRGARTLSHGGLWAGFRSTFLRFPEQGLTVVILGNAHDLDATAMGFRVADLYLPASLTPMRAPPEATGTGNAARWQAERPAREEFLPLPSELDRYAGEYRSAELDVSYQLEVEEGVLVARHFRVGRRPLHPLAVDIFAADSFGILVFTRDDGGEIDGFTANSERVRRLRFDRVR
jgi:CubicO group peptidase (beta-lactamase class C family)